MLHKTKFVEEMIKMLTFKHMEFQLKTKAFGNK